MLGLRCSAARDVLAIDGGITGSIFPIVEQMLMSGEDFYESLQFVSARKNMSKYVSVIDFLFCEIYRDYQKACFRFYEGKGPQLRSLITEEQIRTYEKGLIIALHEARTLFRETRAANWGYFYEAVHRGIKKAA